MTGAQRHAAAHYIPRRQPCCMDCAPAIPIRCPGRQCRAARQGRRQHARPSCLTPSLTSSPPASPAGPSRSFLSVRDAVRVRCASLHYSELRPTGQPAQGLGSLLCVHSAAEMEESGRGDGTFPAQAKGPPQEELVLRLASRSGQSISLFKTCSGVGWTGELLCDAGDGAATTPAPQADRRQRHIRELARRQVLAQCLKVVLQGPKLQLAG